jgi:hypothetical protein
MNSATAAGAVVGVIIAALVIAAVANMVSEEVRTRLEKLPRTLIWLAALWLPRDQRPSRRVEWLGELDVTMLERDGLPVTRLLAGTEFALGLFFRAEAVRAELISESLWVRVLRGVLGAPLALFGGWTWLGVIAASNGQLRSAEEVPITFMMGLSIVSMGWGASCC